MIAHVDNRITYNGNGNATEFAYQFKILDRTDIKVMLVKPDGSTQILSKDYYVDVEKNVVIYPGYAPGAEIPESERPPVLPAGWRLVLYREVPITQLVRLPEIWPFNVIEAMADKLTIICQQLKDKLSRALTINESSASNIDTTVPWVPGKTFRVSDDGTHLQATEDPGKVIDEAKGLAEETATNAQEAKQAAAEIKTIYNSGGLTPVADLAGSIGTAIKRWGYIFANKVFAMNLPIVYKSVAEMKADSLLFVGMTACTLGYYAPNDGGAGTYIIRAKQASDVDDGGSVHELVNGNVAELVVENGTVCPEQFGAKGDGVSDDTEAIIKCLSNNATMRLNNKEYYITSPLRIANNKRIVGNNIYTSIIKYSGRDGAVQVDGNYNLLQGFTIKGGLKVLSHNNDFVDINVSNADAGIYCDNQFYLCNFKNCKIRDNIVGVKIAGGYALYVNFLLCTIERNEVGIVENATACHMQVTSCCIEGNRNVATSNGFGIIVASTNLHLNITDCFFESNGSGLLSADICMFSINSNLSSDITNIISKHIIKKDNKGIINIKGNTHNFTKYSMIISGYLLVASIEGCSFSGKKSKYNVPVLITNKEYLKLEVHAKNLKCSNTDDMTIEPEMQLGIKGTCIYLNAPVKSSETKDVLFKDLYTLNGKNLFIAELHESEILGTKKTLNQYQANAQSYWRGLIDNNGRRNAYTTALKPIYFVDGNPNSSTSTDIFPSAGETTFFVTLEYGKSFKYQDVTSFYALGSYSKDIFPLIRAKLQTQKLFANEANMCGGNLYILSAEMQQKLKDCLAIKLLDFNYSIYNNGDE